MMFGKGKIKWLDIEIDELRGGNLIRVIHDKVQRRTEKDGSSEYYLKGAKTTFEAQEFEMIYIDETGSQTLKVFSPAKNIYLPIHLVFAQLRKLTEEEEKQISDIKINPEEQLAIENAKGRAKQDLKALAEQRVEAEKLAVKNKLYRDIYNAEYQVDVDTETLNHAIYKLQKNHLRLTAGAGISPTMILTMTIIFIAVAFMMMGWAQYNYFLKPSMEFWNEQAPKILQLAQTCPGASQVAAAVTLPPVK
jgi:hypothetical protein